jgi:hypothetical protein
VLGFPRHPGAGRSRVGGGQEVREGLSTPDVPRLELSN